MRVLIVGQYFWPESFRINEIAQSLVDAGCRVSVLTGPPNYPTGTVFKGYSAACMRIERKGELSIYRVPLVPRGKASALRLALNYLTFVLSASVFGPWLLRRQHFDAVLVYAPGPILQSLPGVWLAFLKRAPVSTWIQDLWPESLQVTGFINSRWALRMVAYVVEWIYRRNDLLLVQSKSFLEPVKAMAGDTPVVYCPNPGELSASGVATQVPAFHLKPGFNVVFAGNLGTVQALDTIIDAAERTRDQHDIWWVLIGDGSRSEWVGEEVRRRGLLQVVLPGRFPPESMPPIFQQASALLVTLVRNPAMTRTIPSKVQAYLAAGKPIIAALDGEGARIVAEAGAGVICAAEDARALSAAVLYLKRLSQHELACLGEAGRVYYRQHFDSDLLARRLMDCLKVAISVSHRAEKT